RAGRAVDDVAIAFAVRDRLGQIIFSDDTTSCASAAVAKAQRFTASFRFYLPYLANGPYAVESFLFERRPDSFALLQHRFEKEFLYVQSPHPSNGLANIAMRAVSLQKMPSAGSYSAITETAALAEVLP